jgi:FixJ family two-component response regulator
LYEAKYYQDSQPNEQAASADEHALSPEMERLVDEILPDPRDRKLLALIVEGRTEVDSYATALGISHLPEEERRVHVKRHRDRVLKRLQRRRAAFDAVRGVDLIG